MNAEIISVGTELLLGHTINTDASYVARELSAAGIGLLYTCTVGDNPGRLKEAVETALRRSDIVISTGGLGPTGDDLTKETIAACSGRKLVLDQPSLDHIEAYFQGAFSVKRKKSRPTCRRAARFSRTTTAQRPAAAFAPKTAALSSCSLVRLRSCSPC